MNLFIKAVSWVVNKATCAIAINNNKCPCRWSDISIMLMSQRYSPLVCQKCKRFDRIITKLFISGSKINSYGGEVTLNAKK